MITQWLLHALSQEFTRRHSSWVCFQQATEQLIVQNRVISMQCLVGLMLWLIEMEAGLRKQVVLLHV